MRDKKDEKNGIYRNLGLITQFGLFMIVPIALMSALGYFLDKWLGTSWIIIVCFFVGAIAGGQNVYRFAMKSASKKQEEPERNILNRRTKDSQNQNEKEDNPPESENDQIP